MIVIKTTNGDRFINESEIKSVNHKKNGTIVLINFKDGTHDIVYQVESMFYTNKADTEIRDYGLALGATVRDVEYWKAMTKSAEDFIERLDILRNKYESFIINHIDTPEKGSYEERFIKEMKEEFNKRPGSIKKELEQFRKLTCYEYLIEKSDSKGDESKKSFELMTEEIEKLSNELDLYRDANKRLMKRNLWERIINKNKRLLMK